MTAASATDAFARGLDLATEIIASVAPSSWDHPSVCAGWTALDVLGHLGTTVAAGTAMLQAVEPTWPAHERPADLVSGEPTDWWRERVQAARAALATSDVEKVVDTPLGPRTIGERLTFPAIDCFVHAWDIGQAIGTAVVMPDDVIELAHAAIDPIPPDMVRGDHGAFGPEVDAPADATPTERFIAWTGRPPR